MNLHENARKHYQIKSRDCLGTIEVPEWSDGETLALVYVKRLTAGQQLDIQDCFARKDFKGSQLLQFIYSACNEDMTPIFKNNESGRYIVENEIDGSFTTDIIDKINKMVAGSRQDLEDEKKN